MIALVVYSVTSARQPIRCILSKHGARWRASHSLHFEAIWNERFLTAILRYWQNMAWAGSLGLV